MYTHESDIVSEKKHSDAKGIFLQSLSMEKILFIFSVFTSWFII